MQVLDFWSLGQVYPTYLWSNLELFFCHDGVFSHIYYKINNSLHMVGI